MSRWWWLRPMRLTSMCSVVAVFVVTSALDGTCVAGDLCLDEVESIELPSGVIPRGGSIAHDGTVLLWSDWQLWEISPMRDSLRSICGSRSVAPRHAFFVGASSARIEFFDSLSSSVLEVTPQWHCEIRPLGKATSAADAVVPSEWGWLELRHRSHGQLSVRLVGGVNGNWSTLALDPTFPGRLGSPADYVFASPRNDGVLITESEYPFRTFRITAFDRIEPLIAPLDGVTPHDRASLLDGWKALRVMPLDGGYLQVLADPRSDKRRFVLADSKGRVMRATALDVAIGMLDVNRERHTLIALRNVGTREVVYYRWRWSRGDQRSNGDDL